MKIKGKKGLNGETNGKYYLYYRHSLTEYIRIRSNINNSLLECQILKRGYKLWGINSKRYYISGKNQQVLFRKFLEATEARKYHGGVTHISTIIVIIIGEKNRGPPKERNSRHPGCKISCNAGPKKTRESRMPNAECRMRNAECYWETLILYLWVVR